jgi:nucleoside-diphosphate-sugar epimerase
MKILVTGGLGFIGSHVITVLSPTHDIVIIDNEQNACDKVLPRLTSITEA